MRMTSLIQSTDFPRTKTSILQDLKELGVKKGMTIIVHSSLKSIGWTVGGAAAVVEALMEAVTEEGTIVMPAQSGDLSDPSHWQNPPVPESWWETIKNEMPAYDPRTTPTWFMGKIVDMFRSYPDVKRSGHPTLSFAAWGKNRDYIVNEHPYDNGLGEESPLAKIYALNGSVLLLGAGYDSNTSMHLAEHRALGLETESSGSPVMENGVRVWKTYIRGVYQEELFPEIGAAFEQEHKVLRGKIGSADSHLMSQRELVDFTENWLNKKRN
ncbi:aminoglycoside N(3)-acetyltransferase [Fictibacillus aquaticus]|uniref:Aminoglycoside N(3)-acetyltransferase n=1 Tax=Fictibacillus aquaticus TaxID=2021314 RepID=A0A235F5P5_9BACL|nr:AAC(3) family N-acetyltransferase [Fictibacillus aquaticus]OYD56504.1 AAC(3) family N-acetyltransferase [Fictibacillus aquaticus]